MKTADRQELLKQEVLADADSRADTVRKRAEREAKKIARDAAQKAKAITDQAVAEASQEAELETRRVLATAPLEQKRRDLSAREELINDAISQATSRLLAQDEEPRTAMLAGLLEAAAVEIGEPELIVSCSQSDAPLLETVIEKARKTLAASGATVCFQAAAPQLAISSGLVVRTPGGHKVVDNTLEARRDRLFPQLRLALAKTLFQ